MQISKIELASAVLLEIERQGMKHLTSAQFGLVVRHVDGIVEELHDKPTKDTAPPVSAWKPIETAPKDGSLILIREAGRRVQVARWTCPYGERFDWYVKLNSWGDNAYPTLNVIEWTPIPN